MKQRFDIDTIAGGLLRALIWLYRHSLSYFMGRQCRFMPTCSVYADEAIKLHGTVAGGKLAVRRFCQCHPWGKAGFDPVPPSIKPPKSLG